MNLGARLKRLEHRAGAAAVCPKCNGYGGPMYHVEFHNGDPPLEGGECTLCRGVGAKKLGMKEYRLDSRATWDAV
jgi:hypothetical protein